MRAEAMRSTLTVAASTPVDVARLLDDGGWGGYQRLVVAMTALSIVIDGVDSQLLGIAIPSIMADFGVSRGAFAPVLASGFVGMMVGGAIAGVVGDRLGRRFALAGVAQVLLPDRAQRGKNRTVPGRSGAVHRTQA